MKLAHSALELRRFAVFGMVGALNTAICYALFALLFHVCGWHHHLALVADYAFGIVVGYVLHRSSTFADRNYLRQAFGKYSLTLVATFGANLALLDLIVRARLLEPLWAQALAMTLVTAAGFLVQTHWVFRQHAPWATAVDRDDHAAPPARSVPWRRAA